MRSPSYALFGLSLCFISALALPNSEALENANERRYLTEKEAGDAAFVSRWLRANGSIADQKQSKWFLDRGLRESQRKNWSAATKAFGESMIRYPSPQALAGYADAEVRMLGKIRGREKNMNRHIASDMKHALTFYEAALSADAVLGTLSVQEKARVRNNVDCLAQYMRSGRVQRDCQPIQHYSVRR